VSMRRKRLSLAAAAVTIAALTGAASTALAHHEITAKFDETKQQTIRGVVTGIDWRNPHVHLFMNVTTDAGVANWAVELESTISLEKSGWRPDVLQPGDTVTVSGIVARDGTRQIWGETLTDSASNRRVLYAVDSAPVAPKNPRPVPRGTDCSRTSQTPRKSRRFSRGRSGCTGIGKSVICATIRSS
jgi:hypothetical protein